MYQIGVDIGGTNIKVGLVSETLELLQSCSVRFPTTAREAWSKPSRKRSISCCSSRTFRAGSSRASALSFPAASTRPASASSTPTTWAFTMCRSRRWCREAFEGVPVYLANDANGAALAELYAGAFRGCRTAVLLTLGTGLGGGIIFGGHMFNGGMNQGVELGHMYLVNGGEHCTCGNDGCMEAYCAASALARDGKRAMLEHPESLIAARAGGAADAVDAKLVIDCAKEATRRRKRSLTGISTACLLPARPSTTCSTPRSLPSAAACAARESSSLPRCASGRRESAFIRRTAN